MAIESKPRIIVAEDSEVNQKLIAHILKSLEYQFVVVENGQMVLDELQKEPYDFVLMDLYMPVMDGFVATANIMKLYNQAQRPIIIALTGNSEEGDREKCKSAGMVDFLVKPVKAAELKTIIENWF